MSWQSFSFILQKLVKLQPYKVVVEKSFCTVSMGKTLTKTDITYDWSVVQTQNLRHCVHHELRDELLDKLLLLLPYITTKKLKSTKKH